MFKVTFLYHIQNCLQLAFKLLYYCRNGLFTGFTMLFKLCLFTFILIPVWFSPVYELINRIFSSTVILNIPYTESGSKNRNLLDIYLPYKHDPNDHMKHDSKKYPVVIFVSGGAWIIGYKLWSFIIAMPLASLGCIVVVPDYRNFPQGSIDDMMTDIRSVVMWVDNHIENEYRGDMDKIVLAGQSAGAHISLCVLVEDFKKKQIPPSSSLYDHDLPNMTPNTSNNNNNNAKCIKTRNICDIICMFIGISGPYDIISLCSHLHRRGLDSSIIRTIFNRDYMKYSPTLILKEMIQTDMNIFQQNKIFTPESIRHHHHDNNNNNNNNNNHSNNHSNRTTPEKFIEKTIFSDQQNNTNTNSTPTVTVTTIETESETEFDNDVHNNNNHSIVSEPSTSSSSLLPDNVYETWYDVNTDNDNNKDITYPTISSTDTISHSTLFQDFPPMFLYHGLNDHTIPHYICSDLGECIYTF